MNHFEYGPEGLACEGAPLAKIAAEVGTPVYVYSRATLERHFTVFRDALAAAGVVDPLVAYAVKANSNVAVLKVLGDLGAGADTVSEGEVRRALAPGGVYAANLADGPPLAHLRGQIATAAARFAELALIADPAVLRGKRFGNAVLVASDAPLPIAELTRRAASDPQSGRVQHGRELLDFTGGAAPVTDLAAVASPAPPASVFR